MTARRSEGPPAVHIRAVESSTGQRYVNHKYTLDFRTKDGSWQRLSRETCSGADSSVVLLYCPERKSIILTSQFRMPVYACRVQNGMSTEVPGGRIEGVAPLDAARQEIREEVGLEIAEIRHVLTAFMSPAILTERVHFFVARYDPAVSIPAIGGLAEEGEELEVLEVPFVQALEWIHTGGIIDGRTILLLYYALASCLLGDAPESITASRTQSHYRK